MSAVELALFKKHVRADDFEEDDDYLAFLLESAEEWVTTSTSRTREELEGMNGGEYPPTLKQAILMLAGHWYNQREAVGGVQMSEVPFTLQALVKPWRKLVRDESRTDEDQAEDPETDDDQERVGEREDGLRGDEGGSRSEGEDRGEPIP